MKVRIEESYPGEALEPEKINKAIAALKELLAPQCDKHSEEFFGKAGTIDGSVDALTEIQDMMIKSYDERRKKMLSELEKVMRERR